ncbi:hypothetical protein QJQ45_030346, partial [Haematococcus lacustris]
TKIGVGMDPSVTQAVRAASGIRSQASWYGAEDRALEQFFKQEEDMAEVSMERHGRAKQLVVFFGAASISTKGGWGADAVMWAYCKVLCRPRGSDLLRGRVVLVDELDEHLCQLSTTKIGVGMDPSVTQAVRAASGIRSQASWYGAEDRALEQFFKQEEDMAEVSMERHGRAKQLVVFFGAASISTKGGWGADAVMWAYCKVLCRPRGSDLLRGRVVLVDELDEHLCQLSTTKIGVGMDPSVTQAVRAASGIRSQASWYGAEDRALEQFFKQEEDMAEVSMERHGRAKQLVVFFGAASISTKGGWGADAVMWAYCKVLCRPRGSDLLRGRVVLVDELDE